MRIVRWALVFWLVSSFAVVGQSSSEEDTVESLRIERDTIMQAANAAAVQVNELRAQLEAFSINDPSATDVVNQYNQAQINHYKHQQKLRIHAVRVLNWQLTAGYLILVIVVGVAGLGLYLSYREVISGLGKSELSSGGAASDEVKSAIASAKPAEKTELILSLQKVQVTSAVTGVVVLVLSLGFLYLFVDRVFSLNPTDLTTGGSSAAENSDEEQSRAEEKEGT